MAIFTSNIELSPDNYPTIRPTLDLNFAATKTLDRRITFTRDSAGTYVDELGIIRYATNNVPRFDHDPDTGESLGLLIEESRTNIVTYSEDFTQSVWQNNQNRANCDNTTGIDDPSGGTTASRWSSGTDSATELIYRQTGTTSGTLTGQTCTKSTWIRRVSNDGSVSFFLGDNVGNLVNSQLDSVPVGTWVRCTITYTIVGNNGDTRNYIAVYPGTDGQPTTIDIWGDQFEIGSFPTSYIPTSGSTVTRAQDFAIIKGTNFTDIFDTNFKEFSLLVDYDNSKTYDGNSFGIIDLWGESAGYNDRIEWFKDNSSPYHIETRGFGQGNAIFSNGTLSASSKAKAQKFATSWYVPDYSNTSSRRFVVSMGGEAVDVINNTTGTTVPQLTRMGIGCSPTRLDFSAGLTHFKKVAVYNKTLPDAQLQGLTQQ